jgi:hypothetical protein
MRTSHATASKTTHGSKRGAEDPRPPGPLVCGLSACCNTAESDSTALLTGPTTAAPACTAATGTTIVAANGSLLLGLVIKMAGVSADTSGRVGSEEPLDFAFAGAGLGAAAATSAVADWPLPLPDDPEPPPEPDDEPAGGTTTCGAVVGVVSGGAVAGVVATVVGGLVTGGAVVGGVVSTDVGGTVAGVVSTDVGGTVAGVVSTVVDGSVAGGSVDGVVSCAT